ncbi:hypothetical protein B0H10DRAFT_1944511 [Mycena sp. CBHHK59/15]|nr:hypothetical protein B0H10DRAFT_1944511 [Mycena sp. CBHHK59/15]
MHLPTLCTNREHELPADHCKGPGHLWVDSTAPTQDTLNNPFLDPSGPAPSTFTFNKTLALIPRSNNPDHDPLQTGYYTSELSLDREDLKEGQFPKDKDTIMGEAPAAPVHPTSTMNRADTDTDANVNTHKAQSAQLTTNPILPAPAPSPDPMAGPTHALVHHTCQAALKPMLQRMIQDTDSSKVEMIEAKPEEHLYLPIFNGGAYASDRLKTLMEDVADALSDFGGLDDFTVFPLAPAETENGTRCQSSWYNPPITLAMKVTNPAICTCLLYTVTFPVNEDLAFYAVAIDPTVLSLAASFFKLSGCLFTHSDQEWWGTKGQISKLTSRVLSHYANIMEDSSNRSQGSQGSQGRSGRGDCRPGRHS